MVLPVQSGRNDRIREYLDERDGSPPKNASLPQGWVAYPVADEHVKELEVIASFEFPPLLRRLFQTKGAILGRSGADVFGIFEWFGEGLLDANRRLAEAKKEYDWHL